MDASKKKIATMDCLNQQRSNQELVDVVILVEGKNLPAHRSVLAASRYFFAMFTVNLTETHQKEVTLHDLDAEAVEQLMDFAYTGELDLRSDNLEGVLTVAAFFQMEDAVERCCIVMERSLNPANCFTVQKFAAVNSLAELSKKATDYINAQFERVVAGAEFLQLEIDDLVRLISGDEVAVTSEDATYKAVLRWLERDIKNRCQYAEALFQHVRFYLLSPEFFAEIALTEPLLLQSASGRQVLQSVTQYHLLPQKRHEMAYNNPLAKRRTPLSRSSPMIYAAGGLKTTSLIECYDASVNEWSSVPPVARSMIVEICSVAVLGEHFYVCGLINTNENAGIERWHRSAFPPFCWIFEDIISIKKLWRMVVLGELLYVVHGSQDLDNAEESVVQVYDPCTKLLKPLDSNVALPMLLRHAGVAALNGLIYICGEDRGSRVLRYNPSTGRCDIVASMRTARCRCSCIVLNGLLYVIGGAGPFHEVLADCERFDPYTGTWTPIASMYERRSGAGLTIYDGLIFAVGGNGGSGRMLRTVEIYDPARDVWTKCSPRKENGSVVNRSNVYFTGGC